MRRREFIAGIGAAAWPVAAWTQQQPAIPVIRISAAQQKVLYSPYRRISPWARWTGLCRGAESVKFCIASRRRNTIVCRPAAELVTRRVAAIFATGGAAAVRAAKLGTASIPIAFQLGADPVELGLVASVNHPGGNVTGVTFLSQTLVAKRVQFLHDDTYPPRNQSAFLSIPGPHRPKLKSRRPECGRYFGATIGSLQREHTARNGQHVRFPLCRSGSMHY